MKFLFAIIVLALPAIANKCKPLIIGGNEVKQVCGAAIVDSTTRTLIADKEDCTRYFKCSCWFQVKMRCRYGQHFNSELEKCMDGPCPWSTTETPVTPDGSGDSDDFDQLIDSKPSIPQKDVTNNAGTIVFLKDDSSEEDLLRIKKEDNE